ncbi:MAG: hypothetical protein ACNS60_08330 [Candidatus Cyclobacteriaceae bacterium M2_1C_046]
MKKINFFLILMISGFISCNPSTTGSVIPFLWDEEPEPSSSQIMVISTMEGEELRNALDIHLKSLGFVVESSSEEEIVTEPSRLEDNLVRLNLVIDNNVVIISGAQGKPAEDVDDVDWEPVKRGDVEGYGSAEWELMKVLASTINSTSVLYN